MDVGMDDRTLRVNISHWYGYKLAILEAVKRVNLCPKLVENAFSAALLMYSFQKIVADAAFKNHASRVCHSPQKCSFIPRFLPESLLSMLPGVWAEVLLGYGRQAAHVTRVWEIWSTFKRVLKQRRVYALNGCRRRWVCRRSSPIVDLVTVYFIKHKVKLDSYQTSETKTECKSKSSMVMRF